MLFGESSEHYNYSYRIKPRGDIITGKKMTETNNFIQRLRTATCIIN